VSYKAPVRDLLYHFPLNQISVSPSWCEEQYKQYFVNIVSIIYSRGQNNVNISSMVVCHAAQENGTCANGVSMSTGTTKYRFSRICSSVMPYTNGTKSTAELASMKEMPHLKFCQDPSSRSRDMSQQNFIKISSFFSSFFSFVISHTFQKSLQLAFACSDLAEIGTCIRGQKANASINFCVNLIKME